MTENKPIAWLFEKYSVAEGRFVPTITAFGDPSNDARVRNVEPLYRHPPAPRPAKGAKPVAWTYTTRAFGNILSLREPLPSVDTWNVEPLYRHPPAPQPATDPAVEAARRKALKAIFAALAATAEASDWAPVMLPRAVLRDLVGEPRRAPEQFVAGYDEPTRGAKFRTPEKEREPRYDFKHEAPWFR